jgi:hypothetical protein
VKGRMLDGRTDLFSWGVVLYEMVTGEKPFTGENLTTIIYKIIHEDPIPPRELDQSIHPGLSYIVTKALEKNPDERYQSGAELISDLENYKSIGGDLEGTRVIAAVNGHTAPPAENVSAPAAVQPAVVASPGGSAAAVAPALEAVQSTVNAPKKPVASALAKRDTNRILAVGAAAVLTLAAAYAIVKQKTTLPSAPVSAPQQQQPIQQQAAVTPPPIVAQQKPAAAKTKIKNTSPSTAILPADKVATDKVNRLAESAAAKDPAKPVVAAENKFGSATINSQPSGAKVTIGGAVSPQWVTPFTVAKLEPGDYDVVFSKPGFVTQTVNMKVNPGRGASSAATLVPTGATVNVTSTPPGANILLDGIVTGKVTPAQINVNAGEHRLLVKKPGFREENTSITLKDGQNFNYGPTLLAKGADNESPFRKLGRFFGGRSIPEGKGVINIKTRPAGAHVIHNGQTSAMVTPARVPMAPGSYDITLQLDGYVPLQRHFTIEKGKVTDLAVDLVPVKK